MIFDAFGVCPIVTGTVRLALMLFSFCTRIVTCSNGPNIVHNSLNNFLSYVESWILHSVLFSFSSAAFKIDFIIYSCEFQCVT